VESETRSASMTAFTRGTALLDVPRRKIERGPGRAGREQCASAFVLPFSSR